MEVDFLIEHGNLREYSFPPVNEENVDKREIYVTSI